MRSGNKNKLTNQNIEKILNAFIERKDIEHFAKLIHNEDIAKNDYNIAVSTYVAKKETREEIDINKLNAEIKEIVARQQKLREAIDAIVKELE